FSLQKCKPNCPPKMNHPNVLPFYRRLLVGIEIGPTGANTEDAAYMARMTGKEIFACLVKAEAEYAIVFMKDHMFAYYNSTVARKCPNLGERDLLQECLVEAARYDMPLILYCQVQYDNAAWLAHPEWRMKDPDGNDIPSRLCYNSGYVEYIKQVLAEMMAADTSSPSTIDGFHIDMLDFGFREPYGCWCTHCQTQFRQSHGCDLPAGPTWDDAWEKMLHFRYDSNTRFCQELCAFVQATRPELAVDFNYHGSPPFSWEVGERPVQHAMNGDFVTAEGLPWAFGYNNPSLLTLFMAGARPGGIVQGVGSRSVYNYHDFTVRPTADMKWEVYTYLAHGAMCTIVDKANYEGTLDPVVFERIGAIFGEARQRSDFFGHMPVPEVGLYYSSRSRDWYGRTDPPRYFAAVSGAHNALVQSHIPLGMIMDETVSLARLRTFPVVYVPQATVLSKEEITLFEQYVREGGNLLITGLTGLCDRYGRLPGSADANDAIEPAADLSNLIGAKLVAVQSEHADNYIRLPGTIAAGEGKFLLDDIPADWPFLTWGPLAIFEPTSAQAFGELMSAHRADAADNLWRQLMSPSEVIGPAVLINQFGAGKVVYVPCSPDAAWVGNYRVPEHRNLIRNLVRYLHPTPVVQVDAPRTVEIVVTQDEKRRRLLVHFIGFNGPASSAAVAFQEGRRVLPPLMEEPPRYVATVTVRQPFVRVEMINAKAQVAPAGNNIVLEIADIHEVLAIYES
uniref:beta-galactosidase trimerization domain-containing protein n=1 Tax=Candidatus Entotheonella palauensis TaxID=93172 RepID=UPI001C4E10C9